ncbi:FtsX-like permease family protein [Streptomyces clavuligerus]|uniref:Putative membrane protein n=5 Tax=Streptomyces clavuligerus TaxID=1901 RepID=E2PUV1_STRCL|nr:FtsX-like permease family protein [Streptomyces clavuligerus]ANW17633.1 peptide ABC transporter permease [Streptomyces clavuligerus]AXU12184.1 ABC transporter permease [Streptomyces clavuligerus]EFG09848.1 Putative membrane protein [Streptomyces clavuligerus]MBY6302052.1 FtsX-like permease family protein [Streptomyces clavuligerus]QCS04965.1 peptide ABC transporter permease [Streptomyces clavuligerus]
MVGFVFLRARGHRLLLTAALLAIALTTAVLATLAGFAGAVGDAGLKKALTTRDAASAALFVTVENPGEDRAATARDAARGAALAFDGLPVTLSPFDRSGTYALPGSLRPRAERGGEPDLTAFADLDRSRTRLSAGTWPTAAPGDVVQVALAETAAERLRLSPGPRVLKLTDRMGGAPVRIRITGTYRPADIRDPYWRLDDLAGRGVREDSEFTTYGPLLTHPDVLRSDRISRGKPGWLATADFSALGADRIGALRTAARDSQAHLSARPALKDAGVVARTALPETLDRLERALLVARATLLIVSLQLVLLAGYALLLVARLLSTERAGETRALLARGASRTRIAWLSALEALLLALPAAVAAPLLAGPLTGLLTERGALARIGLRIETGPTPALWLVGGGVALLCALAVVAPALAAARAGRGAPRELPGPLRAGADLALLAVAGVAYWQLERRGSGTGTLSGDRAGRLGVDPLLVVAPALALLAATVLTLRLLPPAARLAERSARRARGLIVPLAGWQFSRRPRRGTGPVLLLVLAVAMGMLAIGQGASWDRSQDDQADFASGAPVRVLNGGTLPQFGQSGVYDGMPGVRSSVAAARTGMSLAGGRQATVLALDTARADGGFRPRRDLVDGDPARLLTALRPQRTAPAGIVLPKDTARLVFDLRLRVPGGGAVDPESGEPRANSVGVVVEDRYGVRYRMQLGDLPQDGRRHTLRLDLDAAAGAPAGRAAGPLTLTAVEFHEVGASEKITRKRFTVERLRAVGRDGTERPVAPPALAWRGTASTGSADAQRNEPAVTSVRAGARTPLEVEYHAGVSSWDGWTAEPSVSVRIAVPPRAAPPVPAALVTEEFAKSTGAKAGSTLSVPLPGGDVKVRIAAVARQLPTLGPGAAAGPEAARLDGGAVLLDLHAVNQALAARPDGGLPVSEWWLYPEAGKAAEVAAAVRARPSMDPGQVQVRDEVARALHEDPLGAGPQTALLAAAVAAALLAAVGFAVATAGALRERAAEFAVLRALGAPRRQLARLVAAEQSLLIVLGLLIGVGVGTVLTRAVVPLIVLTGQATQPIPGVLVHLPLDRVATLLTAVAAVPVLIVGALALRRGNEAGALRVPGGE